MRTALLAALAIAAATPAIAHITMVSKTASPGASFDASLHVSHGCSGASTISIRVRMPVGVYNVTAPAKAGWKVALTTGKYPMPFTNKGTQLTEGVTEVTWSGGSLPDKTVEDFPLTVSIADSVKPIGMLFFPMVQECAGGAVERWIEIPAAGKVADDYKSPAPSARLVAR